MKRTKGVSRRSFLAAAGGAIAAPYFIPARALGRGGSLLPAGVTRVAGDFEAGDTVRVVAPDGRIIAVGLANYASTDLGRLCGHQSAEIETLLGYTLGDEVIHRNYMVLL